MAVSISGISVINPDNSLKCITTYTSITSGFDITSYLNAGYVPSITLSDTLDLTPGGGNMSNLEAHWATIQVPGKMLYIMINDKTICCPYFNTTEIGSNGVLYTADEMYYAFGDTFGLGLGVITESWFSYYCCDNNYVGIKLDAYYL